MLEEEKIEFPGEIKEFVELIEAASKIPEQFTVLDRIRVNDERS